MSFDETIKIGDLLTSASVLVSVAALVGALWRDRALRRRELADKIRAAAGKTLARLERWQEISLALYTDVQPLFIEVSEDMDRNFEVVAARDKMWKELNRVRLTLLQEIRQEEIETAYVELYTYRPEARDLFRGVMARVKAAEAEAFQDLLMQTQADIMSLEKTAATYHTAQLGNRLRRTAAVVEQKCATSIRDAIVPLQEFLFAIMSQSDNRLLRTHRVAAASTGHAAPSSAGLSALR
jgi:hypothetical protein